MTRFPMVLLAWAAGGLSLFAQFVVPEGSRFHNGSEVLLADDGTCAELLTRLKEAISKKDSEDIGEVMRQLRARSEGDFVPFGPRTLVSAVDRAADLITASGEGEAWRIAVESENKQAVTEALAQRDLDVLLDFALRGRSFPSSRKAALGAARLLFEQGYWWGARAMALRVGDEEEAVALVEACGHRLDPRDSSDRPEGGDEWSLILTFRRPLGQEEDLPLPAAFDGREGEVVLLDDRGLFAFAPNIGRESMGDFSWESSVLKQLDNKHLTPALPLPADFWFAKENDRLVVPFNLPLDLRGDRRSGVPRLATLVALDLPDQPLDMPSLSLGSTPEASVAWTTQTASPDPSTAFGPPLIAGSRVFVQQFRTAETTEVSLLCFDEETGEFIFETPIVRGAHVRRFSSRLDDLNLRAIDKRGRDGVPAEKDGVIFVCTGFGAVAAVDGWTGQLLHVFQYDRLFPVDVGVYDAAYLFDREPSGWEGEPVRLWNDRLIVAPSDSRYLYVLGQTLGQRGHVILDDPIEKLDRLHIVGLLPDPKGSSSPAVLASRRRDGRVGLVLLGSDGHVLEAGRFLPEDDYPAGWPWASRPVMVESDVFIPTFQGVRLVDVDDLTAEPVLLGDGPEGVPPYVAELRALRNGLVGLSPFVASGDLVVRYWERTP